MENREVQEQKANEWECMKTFAGEVARRREERRNALREGVYCDLPDSGDVIGQLEAAGDLVQERAGKLREGYFGLCRLIRVNQIHTVTVQKVLKFLGFRKERISEILRVSCVSDEMWKEFEVNFTGFKPALAKARGENKTGEVQLFHRWNSYYAQFSRLADLGLPEERHVQYGTCHLVVVDEAEMLTDEVKEFECDGLRVVVTRVEEKPAHKRSRKEQNNGNKKTGNRGLATRRASDDCGISQRVSGEGHVSRQNNGKSSRVSARGPQSRTRNKKRSGQRKG